MPLSDSNKMIKGTVFIVVIFFAVEIIIFFIINMKVGIIIIEYIIKYIIENIGL